MAVKRSEWKQFQREVTFALALAVLFGLLILLSGCSYIQPVRGALPGANYGDGGKTVCGYQTTVRADLKPCK